jgi:hypothetical protein
MDVWAEHLPEHLTQHLLGKGERPELFFVFDLFHSK